MLAVFLRLQHADSSQQTRVLLSGLVLSVPDSSPSARDSFRLRAATRRCPLRAGGDEKEGENDRLNGPSDFIRTGWERGNLRNRLCPRVAQQSKWHEGWIG